MNTCVWEIKKKKIKGVCVCTMWVEERETERKEQEWDRIKTVQMEEKEKVR